MKMANITTIITATMAMITIGHTYTGIVVAAAAATSVLKSVVVPDVVSSSVVVIGRFVGEGSKLLVPGSSLVTVVDIGC